MTFTQFRIVTALLLIASVVVTMIPFALTATSIICGVVSSLAAIWIAYWAPQTIISLQEQYGLDLDIEVKRD